MNLQFLEFFIAGDSTAPKDQILKSSLKEEPRQLRKSVVILTKEKSRGNRSTGALMVMTDLTNTGSFFSLSHLITCLLSNSSALR